MNVEDIVKEKGYESVELMLEDYDLLKPHYALKDVWLRRLYVGAAWTTANSKADAIADAVKVFISTGDSLGTKSELSQLADDRRDRRIIEQYQYLHGAEDVGIRIQEIEAENIRLNRRRNQMSLHSRASAASASLTQQLNANSSEMSDLRRLLALLPYDNSSEDFDPRLMRQIYLMADREIAERSK